MYDERVAFQKRFQEDGIDPVTARMNEMVKEMARKREREGEREIGGSEKGGSGKTESEK